MRHRLDDMQFTEIFSVRECGILPRVKLSHLFWRDNLRRYKSTHRQNCRRKKTSPKAGLLKATLKSSRQFFAFLRTSSATLATGFALRMLFSVLLALFLALITGIHRNRG